MSPQNDVTGYISCTPQLTKESPCFKSFSPLDEMGGGCEVVMSTLLDLWLVHLWPKGEPADEMGGGCEEVR